MKSEMLKNNPFQKEQKLEEELRKALHQIPSETNDVHLYATILLARKEACRKQNRSRVSFTRFLCRQIPLIGWKLWSVQAVFLLLACGILSDSSEYLKSPLRLAKLLFCLSITVFMTALPFLYRSVRYRMQEIEAATHFSSVRLLLAKLIVIGIGDISLLVSIFLATLVKMSLSPDITVIYLCFPFLLSGSGCLFMLGHFPPNRFFAGSFLFCFGLILVFAVLPGQYALLFYPSFSMIRTVLCVLLFAFCAYQLHYIVNISSYEAMQIV